MTSCTRVSRQIAYKYKHVAKYYHLLYIITASLNSSRYSTQLAVYTYYSKQPGYRVKERNGEDREQEREDRLCSAELWASSRMDLRVDVHQCPNLYVGCQFYYVPTSLFTRGCIFLDMVFL